LILILWIAEKQVKYALTENICLRENFIVARDDSKSIRD